MSPTFCKGKDPCYVFIHNIYLKILYERDHKPRSLCSRMYQVSYHGHTQIHITVDDKGFFFGYNVATFLDKFCGARAGWHKIGRYVTEEVILLAKV